MSFPNSAPSASHAGTPSQRRLPIFTFAAPACADLARDDAFGDDDDLAPGFAPQLVHAGSLDEQDAAFEDEGMLTPSPPSYRHAVGMFTTHNAHNDLSFNAFSDASFFEPAMPQMPTFVLDKHALLAAPKKTQMTAAAVASPLSPCSYVHDIEVPQKMESVFDAVHPTFTSREAPAKIMNVVKSTLESLQCEVDTVHQWSLQASCLSVAEEIRFGVNLYQVGTSSSKYEVEFVHQFGDQARFFDLHECIRARCSDIDDDACLAMLSTELDAWMDDQKEVTGRRFVIKDKEAEELLQELSCDHLHIDTLYEVAKTVKNHCRHRRNRELFLQVERKDLLKGLQWMLSDNTEMARYALFILQQYAKDQDISSSFFATPFERSTMSLLLDDVMTRESDSDLTKHRFGARSLTAMIETVRQSALFA